MFDEYCDTIYFPFLKGTCNVVPGLIPATFVVTVVLPLPCYATCK